MREGGRGRDGKGGREREGGREEGRGKDVCDKRPEECIKNGCEEIPTCARDTSLLQFVTVATNE